MHIIVGGLLAASALAPCIARAQSSPDIVSSPVASESLALHQLADQQISPTTQSFTTGITRQELLGAPLSSAGAPPGLGAFYYRPGAGSDLAGNPLQLQSPSTYGLVNNVQSGAFKIGGLFVLSGGSQTLAMSQTQVVRQAIDQTFSFAARDLTVSGSLVNIGKDFQGGTALTSAMASSDDASKALATAMLARKGQDEQNIALGLGDTHTGLLTFKWDDLTDTLHDKNTSTQSLGYQVGSAQRTQFTYNWNDALDRVGQTQNQSQVFGIQQVVGDVMTLTANHMMQDTSSVASGSVNTTTDQLQAAFDPKHFLDLGLNLNARYSHDDHGGFDHMLAMNVKRVLGRGFSLGMQYGNEEKMADDSTGSPVETIRTFGFSGTQQIAKIASITTNWLSTDDSSRAEGTPVAVNESTTFSLTPWKDLSLQNQFTTNDHTDNRTVGATYSLPSMAALGTTKVAAAMTTECSPSAASTQATKVALDTSLPKLSSLVRLLSVTSVHLEELHSNTSAWSGTGPSTSGTQIMGLAGSLAALKAATWSYTFATQDSSANQDLPDARTFDMKLPMRFLTLTYSDHDQVVSQTGLFQDSKERKLDILGLIPHSKLQTTLCYDQKLDDTTAVLTQTNSLGWDFSGPTGKNQTFEVGLTQQHEQEEGNGSDASMIYKLHYNFTPNDNHKVTLACDTTTNNFTARPGSRDNTDATVSAEYSAVY